MLLGFVGGVVVGFTVALFVGQSLITDAKTWGEQLLSGIESRLTAAIGGGAAATATTSVVAPTTAAETKKA